MLQLLDLICTKCKEDPGSESDSSMMLTLDHFFSDNAINKEIQELRVHCVNQGCGWRSTLKDFEDHQSQCEYALIPCNIGCGLMVLRKTLATHLEKGCPNNKTTCQVCCSALTPAELQKHSCSNGTEKNLSKAEKRKKVNLINQFKTVSCFFSQGNPDKVREHEVSSTSAHLHLLVEVVRNVQMSVPPPPERTVQYPALDLISRPFLFRERCFPPTARVFINEAFCAAVLQVAEQQQRLIRKDLQISSLQQSISAQQDVSYDGTFLWRICDVSQKLKEAATGQKSSQYSPAFYTSRYGFKVCMRLYMYGDGVGKGTHISLFFVIMKGDYDPLLSWPFKQKVTFFLIDQNQREHVVDAFRPDLRSASFQRPVSEMNVASGCPLFFPLSKLRSPKHAYVKDDTLFIKCVVDPSY
uniref:TNF receptor-associated factor n=1 Tax=Astyanax mexicanus TaxID=7994 RepID=A0A8B9JLL0_ASTMX